MPTAPKAPVPVAPAPVIPPLPSWSDAASVQSYVTSITGLVVGFITTLHPGFTEPAAVQGIVGAAGFIVAGVAQIVSVITHRSVQKAAVVAAAK